MAASVTVWGGNPTAGGVDIDAGGPFDVTLVPGGADVRSWTVECFGTDEAHTPEAIQATQVIDTPLVTMHFSMPADVCALGFRSTINAGRSDEETWTFGVFVPIIGLGDARRLVFTGQTNESSTLFGWIKAINEVVRGAPVGPSGVAAIQAFGANVTPSARLGDVLVLTVTDATPLTIHPPATPTRGQILTFEILNSSGGAMGALTWDAIYLLAGASWTDPANTKRRTITFYYDGTNWVEVDRAAADI